MYTRYLLIMRLCQYMASITESYIKCVLYFLALEIMTINSLILYMYIIQYLQELECPYEITNPNCLLWLLSHGISLEFEEKGK